MRTLFVVLALMAASTMYAQPEAATVYNTRSNAPVTVSGNVNCSENSIASGELTFTNTSTRNIVELEATARVKCMRGAGQLIRYHHNGLFFQTHGLASGESVIKAVPEADEQLPRFDPGGAPAVPRVDVEILFVQFEDGSTWGDASVIRDLRVRRKSIEALLGRLASVPDDRDFDSMLDDTLAAFTGDPFAYTMAFKISEVRKESGTEAARIAVRERLRVAEEREASGKF
jgi:hypothetical protein